ncbi:HNH endonuclease [Chryseobacterium vrystaatense]|uniref:5-methylcytosine-specific restriction enzyme A n=1 Tax=Chryseobacterium vrystaatense TaxID=307480 RepID=A0A1M5I9I2_9FLAO|nr:HNH endonuclease [Chryseobacterium vrystaatense]SHG24885.1 5-methylcytosine-specific restriction enzyme A [Chryseobacterium vrystaatense]
MIKIKTGFEAHLYFGNDHVTGRTGLILKSGGGVEGRNSHHSKLFKDLLNKLKAMKAVNVTIYVAAASMKTNSYPSIDYRKVRFKGETVLDFSQIDVPEFVKAANEEIKEKGKLNPGSPYGSLHKRLLITSDLDGADWNRLFGNIDEVLEKQLESIDSSSETELEYILQRIKKRLRQMKFRRELLEAYRETCAVTGCKTVCVLEAAHIRPHSEGGQGIIANGILLRSDIHDLFDQKGEDGKRLLNITSSHTIEVHELLRDTEYWDYNGKKMTPPQDKNKHPKF